MPITSMATIIEDWLVTQIQAIQAGGGPLFVADEVKPWEGNLRPAAGDFVTDLMEGERDTVVRVLYTEDTVVPLDGSRIELRPNYAIVVGRRNLRDQAAARRGGDGIGTNDIRDLLQQALHGQRPNLGVNGRHSKMVEWAGSRILFAERNSFIQVSNLVVAEVPANN